MATRTRTRPRTSQTRTARSGVRKSAMILERTNYVILGASVVAIALGFAIMRIENDVDGFISLYVSPLILISGYIGVIIAILWRSNKRLRTEENAPTAV